MSFDPDIHHRRSIRLAGYNYSAPGAYFVTLCIQHKLSLLGDVEGEALSQSDAGRMVEHWWLQLPVKFQSIDLDHYIIMPNHFHGLLHFTETPHTQKPHPKNAVGVDPGVCPASPRHQSTVGADPCVSPSPTPPTDSKKQGGHTGPGKAGGHTGPPLPQVIQWFKTMTTNAYIHGVKNHKWPPFAGRLWQRNYFERVIRNKEELHNVREYIYDNPNKWPNNPENPASIPPFTLTPRPPEP